MAHSKRIRNLITELGAAVIWHHQLADGSFDTPAFYREVERLFRTQHPADVWEVERESVGLLVQLVCDHLERFTKATYVVGTVRGKFRVFVKVPPEVGEGRSFTMKMRRNLTLADARRMLAYHIGKLRAHAKEVAFWRTVVAIAEKNGMAETDSVANLIQTA